ncbi:sulfatase modifying factor 1 [Sphingomonas sp. SORGH_AS 950]|uniref:formylglycine-generating enzyme family protein n=1 Tax=Sphingomonas sp. SORGH_AS_0950 TaxID=3041792 RepID=UPI0027864C93|nr:formylglycine-generating enzyme family protein [Sphingomonas sp. SORGH_AS_0950]MDQ1158997.1 sulfatase modifying factor 1 [Sphingomonas sp. SORGH_AS_0950]
MRVIPGHTFEMGSDRFYPEERPARPASVSTFRIDATPVTNAMFARFVEATGHVTEAERGEDGRPGSLLFAFHDAGTASWRFIDGLSWQTPHGHASRWSSIEQHPVVHVGHSDAQAYAAWAGKRLATEVEWEAAACGGLHGCDYAWGDTLTIDDQIPASIWEGDFPSSRTQGRELPFTTPVASHEPNGFGLFDMIGNVWEWTATKAPPFDAKPSCCGTERQDEAEGGVIKGGSHLCAPNWCRRYRPAARQIGTVPTSHIGFRCAADLS